jgi:hypothetical protein
MTDNVVPLGPSRAESYALDIIEPFGEGDGLTNLPVSVIKGLLADINMWRKAALLRGRVPK